MGRNSAVNQKRYRDRKKKDAAWRKSESGRVKGYYKRSASLTPQELRKRRKYVREYVKQYRAEKKRLKALAQQDPPVMPVDHHDVPSSSRSSLNSPPTPMTVSVILFKMNVIL